MLDADPDSQKQRPSATSSARATWPIIREDSPSSDPVIQLPGVDETVIPSLDDAQRHQRDGSLAGTATFWFPRATPYTGRSRRTPWSGRDCAAGGA